MRFPAFLLVAATIPALAGEVGHAVATDVATAVATHVATDVATDPQTSAETDPETGLQTWQAETRGILVRLTQISPDQARAFYQARGFSSAQAEHYAAGCVFMTVVRNIGGAPIEHRLSDWRYVAADGQPRRIRGKAEWSKDWRRMGVPEPARIAFAWAQFPSAQTFAAGDWNQGMTHYELPRGGRFDLIFKWRAGAQPRSGKLENLRCADDRHD